MSDLAAPASPFKGLAAFEDSDLDALFFFGREREREVLVANLLAARLTILYGESGVGKSSLLAAGVVRALREVAPETVIALRSTWSGVIDDILDDVRDVGESYLILDQFEEYFVYHSAADEDEPGTLLRDLPELLRRSRVNVLIALREDSLARLDAFKARIPSVFANQVRLEHLDRDAGRAAILGPIERWNELTGEAVTVEPALVEAVLDEVSAGRVDGVGNDRSRIEAPYLQLVLERIWAAERADGSSTLRLATLMILGGAAAIVRDHLQGALDSLVPAEREIAARVFEHLVTPSGTKIAHHVADLADYADVPQESLRTVLSELTRDRIVHSVDGSDRYEIFHDVLAEPIRAWREQRRLDRERIAARHRHRRLLVVTAFAFVALAFVAGLAVWALSERSVARSDAQRARARAFQARALQQLTIDPGESVQLALAAARLEPVRTSEEVLRQALIADRLRLVRHAGAPVSAVAVSSRGDLVAAAVSPGTVLILDARNRRLIRTIPAHGAVAELSFASNGRRLVTASPNGVAHIVNVRTGHLLSRVLVAGARDPDGALRIVPVRGRLRQALAHVRRLSVTPSGDLVAAAVAERDGRVRAWIFARDGRLLRVLQRKGIRDLAFSPDGRLLATASAEGLTQLWDPRTGRTARTLLDAKHGANAVAFSPDGTLIATGGEDSGIRIWSVASGERTYFLFGHTNPVSALAWSPDGRVVASASADSTVKLWRVQGIVGAGSLAATLSGNGAPVRSLAFSADDTRLVTGGADGTVRVWDARPDEQLDLLGRARGSALTAQWAGKTVVGLWSSGIVKTFDMRSRRVTHVLETTSRTPTALDISQNASVIAAGGGGTIDVWDGRTGSRLSSDDSPAGVLAVAVAPDGDLVAGGDRGGTVRVWHARGGAPVWSGRQAGEVLDLAFSARGDRLVGAGPAGATVWSAADGRRVASLPSSGGDVRAVFSPDGALVATAGADGNGRIWFSRTGKLYRPLRGDTKALTDIAFGADGRLLATSSKDSDGRIWGVAGGRGHVLQRASFGPLSSIAFDSTGRWVVGGGPISAIIWNAASGRQLFYLRGHTNVPTGVAFAPHSETILTSSRDGTVRTYACLVCVDLPGLVHLAEHRLAQTR